MVNAKDKQKLRQTSTEDLQKEIESLSIEAAQKRNELALGKLKDTKVVTKIRKRIAVIKTIMRETELASKAGAQS